ncbi:7-carboxy-7-deazaguanine synthase QueE [Fulvivirgaceae bacterium BMA10]|uniref:7-carboxy-7-deazaguanine synthase n=1 Tax=Splendidivirga corallicola TaxID=3051826 RepID=A0ABT8KIL7_9BACT|nr:7-carboxy-7-deazaguanine synthase QueE [Fulvivirgaceae bacterium BMA10]
MKTQLSETILDTLELPVMEAFYTIQGEGFHQGKAAYFIRLAGCDVGCHWCDVKESWDATKFPKQRIKDVVAEASKSNCRLAVITGGEPLMHNLDVLTEALQLKGFKVHLETSGAHPLSGRWDWICFSPKKFKKPLPGIYDFANELKVVVYNKSDFAWAESFAENMREECLLYLQPEWSKQHKMLPLIIDYIKDNPKWQVSLQTHKYMDIP